ncbi:MAG TPA: hypothetical protein ENK42_03600 [Deltaproteobacteria bacterium]|nr:hypothetical protein [Deltaproteobacteria bacterium]
MKPALSRAALYLFVGILISCTSTYRVPPEGTLDGYIIKGVPIYTQKRLECGPSSLASVLGYHGIKTDPEEIASKLPVERLGGTLAIDLLLYAKERGLSATYYRGSLEDLKEKIRHNLPLIIFVDLGVGGFHIGHFMVVTGYDDRQGGVIVHSGKATPEFIPYKRLKKIWKKTGFSTLLIRPAA